jgi:DNA-binding NtrC family response regulator
MELVAPLKSVSSRTHILLIDDDDDFRQLFRIYFSNRGYTVTTVSSAQEALRNNRSTVDLVLVDLGLSGLNCAHLLKTFGTFAPNARYVGLQHSDENEPEIRPSVSKMLPLRDLLTTVHSTVSAICR